MLQSVNLTVDVAAASGYDDGDDGISLVFFFLEHPLPESLI